MSSSKRLAEAVAKARAEEREAILAHLTRAITRLKTFDKFGAMTATIRVLRLILEGIGNGEHLK